MKNVMVVLAVVFSLTACKREKCKFKELGPIECSEGFTEMEANIVATDAAPLVNFGEEATYIITSEIEYDSIFDSLRPFGDVNFSVNSVLGMEKYTDLGDDIRSQGFVCQNDNTIRFTGEYSLKDQCSGSGINYRFVSFWAIIPRDTENRNVEFVFRDINPISGS